MIKLEKLGNLAIDSGTVIVGDPCYLGVKTDPRGGAFTQLAMNGSDNLRGVVVGNFGGDVPATLYAVCDESGGFAALIVDFDNEGLDYVAKALARRKGVAK